MTRARVHSQFRSVHTNISTNIRQLFAEGEVNLGEYSPRFTEPEANNCFSLIFRAEYQELQNKEL